MPNTSLINGMISSGILSNIVRKTSSNIVLFAIWHPFRGCYVSFAFVSYKLWYFGDFCILIMFSDVFLFPDGLAFVEFYLLCKVFFCFPITFFALYCCVFYFSRQNVIFPVYSLLLRAFCSFLYFFIYYI